MLVDKIGAQIVSFKIDGVEVMYQGALNPSNSKWKATAKNLFPNPGPVGTTNDVYGELKTEEYDVNGKIEDHVIYVHNGGKYHMGQHGFAQSKEFRVGGVTDDTCVLSISAKNNQTYTEYPYDYTYYIALGLEEYGFNYLSCAQNNDTKPMLAGMGWHPAFKLHGNPKNYSLVLKNLVKDEECELEENVEYDIYETVILKNKSRRFTGIKSANVVLMYTDENGEKIPYLSMHVEDPILILWSKNAEDDTQEQFICIEPWNTTPRQINNLTTQDKTREIREKGAVIIEPGEQSKLSATIEVNPEYIAKIAKNKDKNVKNSR